MYWFPESLHKCRETKISTFLFRDPDNVVLCILATDDDDVKDVALQIHFTLIQAFCCENDINILRVNNTRRLAHILGGAGMHGSEQMDLHCILVTVSVNNNCTWDLNLNRKQKPK